MSKAAFSGDADGSPAGEGAGGKGAWPRHITQNEEEKEATVTKKKGYPCSHARVLSATFAVSRRWVPGVVASVMMYFSISGNSGSAATMGK